MKNYAHLPACFITGTDTDAGKTTVTAALLLALFDMGIDAHAIKPVQTGCSRQGEEWIAPDVVTYRDALESRGVRNFWVPHCFVPACSPHLAARKAGTSLEARNVAEAVRARIKENEFTLVEGAGGLMAPLNESETMLDLMLELDLPVLLTVPNRLGCISDALMAMRVLAGTPLRRAGIVLCRLSADDSEIARENCQFIARRGAEAGFPFLCELPFCPDLKAANYDKRQKSWRKLAGVLAPCAENLRGIPSSPASVLDDDRDCIWHPYAGTAPAPRVYEAAGARGTHIRLSDGRELLDGMSSWWCANMGYGRGDLQNALGAQSSRLPHVMFGGFTHEPAVKLAKKLISITPSGFERVFFADSGSVAVEVALKMALQYQMAAGFNSKNRICALRGAYHGDTMGAMSVCDPVNGMHNIFRHYLPRQLFLDRPSCRFDEKPDKAALAGMGEILREHAPELAAVIVEPIVQGAGGMWFYHPAWLEYLRDLCDELGILLIADEIATGFGRTGKLFACEWARISPDIMCLGKALTGGMMSFAAVLANGNVAKTISQPDNPSQPGILLHGPTFMANPLACAVALRAVETLLAYPWRENVKRIEQRLISGLAVCRNLPGIRDVRVLGAIGVVETEMPVNTEKLQKFFVSRGVWIRPFNHLVYLMPPFIANDAEIDKLTDAVCAACQMGLHQ